ncbi:MAG: sulfatase [Anaerolineales bacterium]
MRNKLSRRDFLKLVSLVPAAYYLPPVFTTGENSDLPNIIILVFDSWSASNISLYGYPRRTTPNLEKLAEKAIVYHNHYAAGHYTVPGTAGLLTGVLEYQHQMNSSNKVLAPYFRENNLFGQFPEYKRVGYSHNLLANEVMQNMITTLDTLKPWQDLYLWANPAQSLFYRDSDISSVGWIRSMDTSENGAANSLFLSRILSLLVSKQNQRQADLFPRGIPNFGFSYRFIIEDAIDWLADLATTEINPLLTYCHLFPPHAPYSTRVEFYNQFTGNGYSQPKKPESFLSDGISYDDNQRNRRNYDEYILYVDAEIGRFFSLMESAGKLEDTWIILTSDHGEIFERGIKQHKQPAFYEPLAKVPLMIFPPGQEKRGDIYTPTSAVDILPTLSAITGRSLPDWTEGVVLPPFNHDYPPNRPVYIADGKMNPPGQVYKNASLMLRKGRYKLQHHFGQNGYYEPLGGVPLSELYDLENDPEELDNLFDEQGEMGKTLLDELFEKMREMGVME